MKTCNLLLAGSLVITTSLYAQQPFPNGGFENWYTSPAGNEMPTEGHWLNVDSPSLEFRGIYKSEDAYSGDYALRLRSYDSVGIRKYGESYTGLCCDPYSSPYGTLPYADSPRFFVLYYKYSSETTDSASIGIRKTDGVMGSMVMNRIYYLPPADVYTKFVIPLSYSGPGNTLLLRIASSKSSSFSDGLAESNLYVDSMYFTNDTSTVTGLNNIPKEKPLSLYPNPASTFITISSGTASLYNLTITDVLGRKVMHVPALPADRRLPVAELSPGMYYLHVTDATGSVYSVSFIRS